MVIQQEMMQGLRGGALASVVTTKDPFPGYQFCASHSYESSQADELSVTTGARVRVRACPTISECHSELLLHHHL